MRKFTDNIRSEKSRKPTTDNEKDLDISFLIDFIRI